MKTKHWSPRGDDLVPRANINVSLCTVCVIVVILQYLKMYVLGAAGLMGFSFLTGHPEQNRFIGVS